MIMKKLKRVSRWITIQVFPITKRNRLWPYAEPSDMGQPDGEQLISAFRFRNRWYAVNQFRALRNPSGVLTGYPDYIDGYDREGCSHMLFCEVSDDGKKIRLHEKCRTEEEDC